MHDRIRIQNSETRFCEKCQNLANDIYNTPDIDETIFNKLLISFIGNHCYRCFCNIRFKHRKKKIESVNNNINIPIDSPFVITNKENNTPKIDDNLKETMENILSSVADVNGVNGANGANDANENNDDEDVEDVNMS